MNGACWGIVIRFRETTACGSVGAMTSTRCGGQKGDKGWALKEGGRAGKIRYRGFLPKAFG